MTSPTLLSGFSTLLLPPFLRTIPDFKKVPISRSYMAMLAFFLIGILSLFINKGQIQDIFFSFKGTKFQFILLAAFFPLMIFFSRYNNKKIFTYLFYAFELSVVIAFIVGYIRSKYQFDLISWTSKPYHPRTGGFYHYMRYGYLSSFLFFFHCYLHFKCKALRKNFLFYVAWLVCLLAIFTSQTRGGLLSVVCSSSLFVFTYYKKTRVIAGGTIIFLLMSISFFSMKGDAPTRLLNYNDQSTITRLGQYQAAIEIFKEKPILGVGPRQFESVSMRIKEEKQIGNIPFRGHAHNTLLEILANRGIIGFAMYLIFLSLWFHEMFLLKTDFGIAVMIYILTYSFAGQFEVLLDTVNTHFFTFIYIASMVHKYKVEYGEKPII